MSEPAALTPPSRPGRSRAAVRAAWVTRLQRFPDSGLSPAPFCAAEGGDRLSKGGARATLLVGVLISGLPVFALRQATRVSPGAYAAVADVTVLGHPAGI